MAVHTTKNMKTAKAQAARARAKGFTATYAKVKGGKLHVYVNKKGGMKK